MRPRSTTGDALPENAAHPESRGGARMDEQSPEAPPPPAIPWEQPGVPWPTGLIETVKLLFTRPREAFERMPPGDDVLRPLLFAIAVGWISTLLHLLWAVPFRHFWPRPTHDSVP